jgi:3-deoxy-D-arabino-heptulosonate 7-phosphate (DAHP) synthase
MNAKFETFFVKALYDAKVEELVNTYREKHFSVEKQLRIEDVEFDVVVRQNGKNIVFLVRVLPLSSTEMSEIDKHHKKAKALGYDFRLITVAKPKKSTIEIAWLDKALLEYFATHPQNTGVAYATAVDYQDIETALFSH